VRPAVGKHALLSPSGFQALMLCPAKPAMERGRPDESSEYADEGTAAHLLGSTALEAGKDAAHYLGYRIVFAALPDEVPTCMWEDFAQPPMVVSRSFTVDADFAAHVQDYVDLVRDLVGPDGELFVEQALPIDHITGEEGAEGTGDAIILRGDEIIVVDLKFGRGVEVQAEGNPQLKLYALGALRKFDLVGDIRRARMVICQPRAGGTTEAVCTVEELQAWAENEAKPAAEHAMACYDGRYTLAHWLVPHEDACRFCKAKADCGALAGTVQTALQREFTDLTTADEVERDAIVEGSVATADAAGQLGAKMDAVPLVELWCKAIRARVEKVLLDGGQVAGYKLVEGKRGSRKWADEAEAEKKLKGMRLKKEDMYDFSLISPTTAEKKLAKAAPKRWKALQPLITQTDGKPSVAPVGDKRPALEVKPLASEFTPITESPAATADDLV
jgi:hypothetical protein